MRSQQLEGSDGFLDREASVREDDKKNQEEHESGAWGGGCAREQRMTVLPEVREVDLSEDVEKR